MGALRLPERAGARRNTPMGSFTCFVPGHPIVPAAAFQQASEDRWCVDLHAETPINDLAAFVSTPLEPGTALSCFIACAPFEPSSFHYLGAITNECPFVNLQAAVRLVGARCD